MNTNPNCVHHWVIGEYLVGHCKKCGATKDFEKLRQQENTGRAMHKGKAAIPVASVPDLEP
jgi:hypothetical protein